jgi:hypothetical protein
MLAYLCHRLESTIHYLNGQKSGHPRRECPLLYSDPPRHGYGGTLPGVDDEDCWWERGPVADRSVRAQLGVLCRKPLE